MSPLQVILLGILQGTTEFLPISSSGHLVIIPYLLGWDDPGLTLDLILHLGTAIAILIYFRQELLELAQAAWQSVQSRTLDTPTARLAWALIIGTIPALIIGFLLDELVEDLFTRPKAAAAFLLGTAVILALSEWVGRRERSLESISWKDGLIIGMAQVLAIAPGLSRSGTTMAAGLVVGYRREDAARFSFLLAVPVILLGGLYKVLQAFIAGVADLSFATVALALTVSAVVGYLSIAGLLALIRRTGLWPFAIYCATFGLLVLTGILG